MFSRANSAVTVFVVAGLCLLVAGCSDSGAVELDAGVADVAPMPDVKPPRDSAPADLESIASLVAKIRTKVNPDYVYSYAKTKFVPPEGKTLLILGQTLDGITEHVKAFPTQPLPGGWAAYWGIPSLDGITNTHTADVGGSQNHQELVNRFPNAAIQSAMWMVGTWDVAKKAGDGDYDQVIKDFSMWAKNTKRPIYLRIGYEFDGPHNELDPQQYVRAYKRIVDLMRGGGVTNVAFVWHSYASPTYKGHPISAWYPGDDYVEWVAVSLFGHMYQPNPGKDADAVFAFAKTHKKPVMIAESSPTNGISSLGDWDWNNWFLNFLSLAYERNIKAISFINEDWTRFSFGNGWGDARLQNNPRVSAAWFMETNKPRYLKASPTLFDELGYAP